jgi:hypothetical protein
MDPALAPDPDPTHFFNDFEDAKENIFFLIFFSYNYPQAPYLQP